MQHFGDLGNYFQLVSWYFHVVIKGFNKSAAYIFSWVLTEVSERLKQNLAITFRMLRSDRDRSTMGQVAYIVILFQLLIIF